jgi:hypothetical protein
MMGVDSSTKQLIAATFMRPNALPKQLVAATFVRQSGFIKVGIHPCLLNPKPAGCYTKNNIIILLPTARSRFFTISTLMTCHHPHAHDCG